MRMEAGLERLTRVVEYAEKKHALIKRAASGRRGRCLVWIRACGPVCGPTGASVTVSRSRCRRAQIERSDLVGAEHDIEAAILVGRTQRDAAVGKRPAELDHAIG
jgi:hypothetical protein